MPNAIITGASKGIGKAIALLFVQNNFNVCICARTATTLTNTIDELKKINPHVSIIGKVTDVSKQKDCTQFINFAQETFQQIDILINNAGTYIGGQIHTEENGVLESLIENNLYSAYHITRATLPSMISQQSGHIFNICSIAGVQPYNNGGSYSISKFALVGFSKNLREELKPSGIKVTTVNPGATMSDSWSGSGIDANRIMEANDIAKMILSAYQLAPQSVVEEIIMRPQLGDL